jgi:hypothetical protein
MRAIRSFSLLLLGIEKGRLKVFRVSVPAMSFEAFRLAAGGERGDQQTNQVRYRWRNLGIRGSAGYFVMRHSRVGGRAARDD